MNGSRAAVIGSRKLFTHFFLGLIRQFSLFLCGILLRHSIHIIFSLILLPTLLFSQATAFNEAGKWGLKNNEKVVAKAVYDSLVLSEPGGKNCLACYKTMGASANKFIKVMTKTYLCNYLNAEGTTLSVKVEGNDTCSVFALTKNTVIQFIENTDYFVVGIKNKKYLIDRNFNQITFKGYYDINFCADPEYLVTKTTSDGVTIYTGLINFKEEQIIPYQYADIKINPVDSLIIGCSAGLKMGTEDDVFDYKGKKIGVYRKHVEMATKNFVIHKLFEPKEYYIVYNIETKEEKNLNADEVKVYKDDELMIRVKNNWFIYNMLSGEKNPYKNNGRKQL